MDQRQQELSPAARAISAAEFLAGAAIVIGHNVFRVVPNEVVILAVLGLVSARWRDGSVSALGLRRPSSWGRIVAIALAAAATRILVGELVVVPLAEQFWPPPVEAVEASELAGNLPLAAFFLLVVWTFAAFGEEIAYRGYLVTRAADVGRGSAAAYVAGVVLVAVLFGYGHFYKGMSGVVDSGFGGLVLGAAYLVARRNLWASILAHGFIDTFAVVVVYLGLAD